MSSVASTRRAPEAMVRIAFERLCEIVETQSHVTLIAERKGRRAGFLLLLDELPDEVTTLPSRLRGIYGRRSAACAVSG